MAIDDRTTPRDYPLPNASNLLEDDVLRLRAALAAIDDDIAALLADVDSRLPSNTYTAADILSKLMTVDGASSGLDADTLDGLQGSSYAAANHAHDNVYAALNHAHTGVYAPVAHDHVGVYSLVGHNHDGSYAAIGHFHAGVYSPVAHTHSYATLTNLPVSPSKVKMFFLSQR